MDSRKFFDNGGEASGPITGWVDFDHEVCQQPGHEIELSSIGFREGLEVVELITHEGRSNLRRWVRHDSVPNASVVSAMIPKNV